MFTAYQLCVFKQMLSLSNLFSAVSSFVKQGTGYPPSNLTILRLDDVSNVQVLKNCKASYKQLSVILEALMKEVWIFVS